MNTGELFAFRMRQLRKARGLSLEALAARTTSSVAAVGSWERGHRAATAEKADEVARALGASLGRMLDPDCPLGAVFLTPCGNCQGRPPAGYRCLSCGLETTESAA